MSITLDQLSPLLVQQHHELCRNDGKISMQSLIVEVDNVDIKVIIEMKKMENNVSQDKNGFRERVVRKEARVEFIPLNIKVREAVIYHFQNQVRQNVWKKIQNELLFDSLIINDEGPILFNQKSKL